MKIVKKKTFELFLFTYILPFSQHNNNNVSDKMMPAEVLTSVCCSVLCSAVMSVQQMTRAEQGDPGVSVTRVYSGYAPYPWLWLRPELGSLLTRLGVRIWWVWPLAGDGAQWPGHWRVSPLPDTLRSPLHHSPEKGDTDTDSAAPVCAGPSLIFRHQPPRA